MDTRQKEKKPQNLCFRISLEKKKIFSDHTYFKILNKTEGNMNSRTAVQPPPQYQGYFTAVHL